MRHKPTIGISLGFDFDYPEFCQEYRIRRDFFQCTSDAGGVPIGLAHHHHDIDAQLAIVDGVIIPSGDIPFPDEYYSSREKTPYHGAGDRLAYETALVQKCIDQKIPILGVCHGMQLLGALVGAKLTGSLRDSFGTDTAHRDNHAALIDQPTHYVRPEPGRLLAGLPIAGDFRVVSNHNEGLCETGAAIVEALSVDGVIEAISLPDHPFALGVQWHAERRESSADLEIFKALCHAAASGNGA